MRLLVLGDKGVRPHEDGLGLAVATSMIHLFNLSPWMTFE